eukprot:SAG31_NODE_145_length_22612_cov_5.938169_4_plen_366_part_00
MLRPNGSTVAAAQPSDMPAALMESDLVKLSAGELRALLRVMSLPVAGRKRELIGRLLDELDPRKDAPPTAASEHRTVTADVPTVADKKTPATAAAERQMEDRVAAASTMTRPKQLKRPTPPPLLPRPHALSPQARLLHHDGDSDRRAAKLPHQSLLQGSVGSRPADYIILYYYLIILACWFSIIHARHNSKSAANVYLDLDEQAWQNFTDEDRRSVDTHALDWAGTLDHGSQGNADSTQIRTSRQQLLSLGVLLEQLPATERRELELLNQLSGIIELENSANISKRDHATRSSGGRWGHNTASFKWCRHGTFAQEHCKSSSLSSSVLTTQHDDRMDKKKSYNVEPLEFKIYRTPTVDSYLELLIH